MIKKTALLSALLTVLLTLNLSAQNRSDTMHVVHYDLSLTIMDFTAHNIEGEAQLTIVSKMPNLQEVMLDLLALTADSVKVNGQNAQFSHIGERLTITVPTIQTGDTVLVTVFYHGVPTKDSGWGGFYFSGQYAYTMGVAFQSLPHCYGRCWFPCMDVFTDKSSYTTHIRTEQNKTAVCGGMLTDVLTLADSSKVWTWQLDEPIPTYLASVAVGEYIAYQDTFHGMEGDIPIVIYAQPTEYANVAASYAHLNEMMQMYEQYFGPYRWPRIGYVDVNFSSGAMEHATNIAYPKSFVNGTDTYVTLYGHELFHHWFGDLITCERPEEMWINEGFASYAEPMIMGMLNPNDPETAYMDYLRDMHHSTLKDIVKNDGDHYALDAVPQAVTYGTHSYDKGALVIHTLRSYLGDSLFFGGLRSLLNHFAWQNVNSEQFFNYLSQVTGVSLADFYANWVHTPGFPQFSIDSIRHLAGNQYEVFLQQKHCGANFYGNSNKIDLTFVSPDRTLYTVSDVLFSGQYATVTVTIPFEPMFGMVDYYEKMMDATVDYTVTAGGNSDMVSLTDAYCAFKVDAFADSVMVRAEHHYVGPDQPAALPEGIHRMSDNHYWNVQLAYPAGVTPPEGYLRFRYERGSATSLDHALVQGYDHNNLKVLYRPTTADSWQIVPTTRTGSPNAGFLRVDALRAGQYCLAVGDVDASVVNREEPTIIIYPNPVHDQLNVWLEYEGKALRCSIVDSAGRIVKTVKLKGGSNVVEVSSLPVGAYFLRVEPNVMATPFVKR
ncbi:MAG: T9SS type A sorting domain-containing protein [Bacteroidales bacterium]|nr:T9SS type A sorting domain-containing protein [Bacteroidales bacterium]